MKVAISLPDPVFDAAERLAEEMQVSRSQLYAEALAEFLESRGAEAVTARLNSVYAHGDSALDPALLELQARTLRDEAW